MLVIASAEHPKKPGQSDAAFWADLLNEEDGDNAIIVPSTDADDDGDGLIDEGRGHGTFVASLVLAVAPGAEIIPYRVLDSDSRGTRMRVFRSLLMCPPGTRRR